MRRAAVAVACLLGSAAVWAVPGFGEVKAAYRTSDTVVLDRHGAVLQRVRTDPRQRRLDWVPLHEVSPAFRHALLLSEDKRFHEHSGVDWPAVGAAAWGNLWSSRTRGASTVTMQLAGLIDEGLATPHGGRSVGAKLGQARVAWQLERGWSKDQILEAYLNLVAFRGEVVGIGALSATLFRKLPSGLDAVESAVAAALIRAPNARPHDVAQRACRVLAAQGRGAACETLSAYTQQVLAGRHGDVLDADAQLAPHAARRVVAGAAPGATLRTTLDAGIQRHARDTLRRQLVELRERHVEDGAVIVIDNRSGEVLAWVGSSGTLSQAADVDGVLAPRQAGSTLKPFLYGLALEARWLTAASLLDDSPVGLSTAAGLYLPQNYDHRFKGPVTLRTALGASLNVPAVRTLVLVTPERFAQRLRALGMNLPRNGDYYGYSLALGSAEVTLADLANAYRALANGGATAPLRLRPGDVSPSSRPVMDPGASFIVADILADREARVPTFGLDNALSPRYWAAVKTGTSKDMRDNWCVGFTRRYTVGVWVGNAGGEPMRDVSGVTGAAPVWRAVMDELERQAERTPTSTPPRGVVMRRVRFEAAVEPSRDEWFLAGTELEEVSAATALARASARINSPADRSVIALDPDIPPHAQQLAVTAVTGTPASWSWRLDGQRIGTAGRELRWTLRLGAHRLELVDAKGRVVESARFEVRGAQPR
ncbi:penicillin-binding protein 1C [Piscinibacter sp. XHJ-5]|uniref:penicillin-binding protein 1C n=1 Tax=Piscinibacter sp. XHJ-5 TaxID=3037797 RepID=UPI0024530BAE|nr:penicillin-binding protein 1C [Piscinibacter sp. XHJ-5]